jgi:Tfp pilus assembly protein PilF
LESTDRTKRDMMQGSVVRCKLRFSIAAAALVGALAAGCATAPMHPATAQKQSWTEKVSASVKSGTDKLTAAVTPKPQPGVETAPPAKNPGPGVFVAMAEMHERSGNIEEAETQLRKALAADPNHLGALLAYAHLEDRQRNFEAATKYYQRALRKHSKNATVHNDMGLCYHRHGKLNEAAKALKSAVELAPHKKLYRDNLAAVLVDQGKIPEALAQLQKAHGEAVGNYNLGYLLAQKRDTAGALRHFRRAAQVDPSLAEAQQWVAQLSGQSAQVAVAGPRQPPPMVAHRPPQGPRATGSIATDAPMWQQQPPVTGPASYAGPQSAGPSTGQGPTSRRYNAAP